MDALGRVGGERESQGSREEELSSETSAVVVLDLYLTLTRQSAHKATGNFVKDVSVVEPALVFVSLERRQSEGELKESRA